MQKLQPTKPPKFERAPHPISVLGGLSVTQRKERHTYKPMPLEIHSYLAWAAGISRNYSSLKNRRSKAFGAVTALQRIEFWLDEVIMTESKLEANRPWALYYKWGQDLPVDEACDPIYSLLLIMGLLEHTPDLHKMDPRYTKILDLADYEIGKVTRAKARTRH